jgi:dihydroorotate dehydrogenase (fumarate)
MDLRTHYLGLELAHPFMPGAGPFVDDLDTVRRLEDAGAPAIVMRSLFEEQVAAEQLAAMHHLDTPAESFGEALSYFPETQVFSSGPDDYLERLRKVQACVGVPVIGSLNGSTTGGWLRYAKGIEEAGADALELNLYDVAQTIDVDAATMERQALEVVEAVRAEVSVPLAVKLSPYYSALPHFAHRLRQVGADGVVLFNRLYQPDIDLEALDVVRALQLSTSDELPLRLRWLAIVSARVPDLSFACSGGVHTVVDALKAVMVGANAVQMVSALLKRGPGHLTALVEGVRRWLEEQEYASLEQLQGSMNQARCPEPDAYTRANYLELVNSWHG